MKKPPIASVICLSALSAFSSASDLPVSSGVIRITGAIVKGPCLFPTAVWARHAGPPHGLGAPSTEAAVSAPSNLCAGIADTQSISTRTVRDAQGVIQGRVVIVSYN